jgi:tetratricopeptide (TPR) repeat protein
MVTLEFSRGNHEIARLYAEDCIASCEASGNLRVMTNALANLAQAEREAGHYQKAIELYQEVLEARRQMGDLNSTGTVLGSIGRCLLEQGDLQAARPYLQDSLASGRTVEGAVGLRLVALAKLELAEGAHQRAKELLEEAIVHARTKGHQQVESGATILLGSVARAEGRPAEALERHRDALRLVCEGRRKSQILTCIEAVASSLMDFGKTADAVVLLAAAERGRLETCLQLSPQRKAAIETEIDTLRAALGSKVFASAWARGEGLSMDDAAAHGLERAATARLLGATGRKIALSRP